MKYFNAPIYVLQDQMGRGDPGDNGTFKRCLKKNKASGNILKKNEFNFKINDKSQNIF